MRAAQPHPEPGKHRRERDDEERIQRLVAAARELPAEERVLRVAIGEEVQRRAGLLELGPEQRRREEEHADRRRVACVRAVSIRGLRNSQPKNATVSPSRK